MSSMRPCTLLIVAKGAPHVALRCALYGEITDAKADERHREAVERGDEDLAGARPVRRAHRSESMTSTITVSSDVCSGPPCAHSHAMRLHSLLPYWSRTGTPSRDSILRRSSGVSDSAPVSATRMLGGVSGSRCEHLGDAREHVRIAAQHCGTIRAHLGGDGIGIEMDAHALLRRLQFERDERATDHLVVARVDVLRVENVERAVGTLYAVRVGATECAPDRARCAPSSCGES